MTNRRIAAAALLLAAAHAAPAATLLLTVGDGIRASEMLHVSVYASETTWMKQPLHSMRAQAPAELGKPGVHTLTIDTLPPGHYAAVVFVDRNGNGKLDRGMFGRPTEPYGFSNGGGTFGPPAFSDAAFELGDGKSAIHIPLN
jgi:uncharacterized protein (DUF2141 family)